MRETEAVRWLVVPESELDGGGFLVARRVADWKDRRAGRIASMSESAARVGKKGREVPDRDCEHGRP
jgi:hypothetical protein